MSVEEIAGLSVGDLADPAGAFLFLWTTNRYLPDAFDVLAAWGFRYRQMIVWHKDDASPFPGAIAPNEAEFVLVGRRGGVKRKGTWPEAIITATRGEHSAKPEVFLDMVEHVAPGPYVELFSRRARFGWDYWGNESLGTAEMPGEAA
jgi:N6-adenosine-specific RNA methylase IME4